MKSNIKVVYTQEMSQEMIHDVHEGLSKTSKAMALSSHYCQKSTIEKIPSRYFWHNISGDVSDYINKCESCQRHGTMKVFSRPSLKSAPISPLVLNQIGVDISSLPTVDGYSKIIVVIDYFNKWSEVNSVADTLHEPGIHYIAKGVII